MIVNGKEIILQKEISVYELLLNEGFDPQRVAVEKNKNIIPRKNFEIEIIGDSDKIEIVTFVGGG
jgi:thiamine biosynthesis protein ThiS